MPTGPDTPITLEPAKRRWRVYFNNHVIADTDEALILREGGLAPVVYFPRRDVAMEYFGRTGHHTRCPHKGEASYYTLTLGGHVLENVAWSYEDPLDAAGEIRERIAFYPDRVEVYEIDDALVNPQHGHEQERELERQRRAEPRTVSAADREEVDEIVQHTDAGDGTSQRERWAPNVETPDQPQGGLR
jgi:uncharacterized protein (DUF427 family)